MGARGMGRVYFGKRQCVQWLNPRPPGTLCPGENPNASFISRVTLIRLLKSLGLFPLLKAGTTSMYLHYGGRRRAKRVYISSSKQAKPFPWCDLVPARFPASRGKSAISLTLWKPRLYHGAQQRNSPRLPKDFPWEQSPL